MLNLGLPKRSRLLGKDAGFLRVWRGELSLYRAAYGLGGLGLAVVSLLGDVVLDTSASAGNAIGWLSFIAVALSQLAFAWVSLVATWRAARTRRAGGRAYGTIATSLALAFVCTQLVLTAAWIGWSGFGLAF
jgi:hypothetical protein